MTPLTLPTGYTLPDSGPTVVPESRHPAIPPDASETDEQRRDGRSTGGAHKYPDEHRKPR